MSIGDYVPTNYTDGGPEPLDEDNLNNSENKINELDKDTLLQIGFNLDTYKDYVLNKSVKLIDNLEDYTLWSAIGSATLSEDFARRFGKNRVRVEENDNVAGYLGMEQTISSLDLTTFQDGLNTSDVNDLIQVAFVTTNDNTVHLNVRIRLGTDSSNYFEWIIPGASLGFATNLHSKAKDDFSTTGSPDWSAITWISLEWESSANQSGEAVRFEWLDMERVESGGSVANPWVLATGGGDWTIKLMTPVLNTITFFNRVTGKISIAVGGNCNEPTDRVMKVYESTTSFYAKMGGLCAGPNMTGGFMWYVDSNNYIKFIVSDFDWYFKIEETVGGVPGNVIDSSWFPIDFKERFDLYIEKKENSINITVVQGTTNMQLKYTTSIVGQGSLYLSSDNYDVDNGWCGGHILEELIISNNPIVNPLNWNWNLPYVLYKYRDQDVVNSIVLDDDLELYIYLPPNCLFMIDAYITARSNSSNTPDIRISWDIGSNEMLNNDRWCNGPGTSITSVDNAETSQLRRYNASSQVPYGLNGSNAASIREHFIIKTSENNSNTLLQLQFAQNTSNADYTRIQAGSHIVITKINGAWNPNSL